MELRHAKIDPSKLRENEELIFNRWKEHYDIFIPDGCVDYSKYTSSPIRLLFLLKEVNGGKDWDLREYLKDGGRPQTWNAVARWTENIFNLERNYNWSELSAQDTGEQRRREYMPKVCAMNVKKYPGESTADQDRINAAVQKDKMFLKEQLDLYQADIIILCGTEDHYRAITDNKKKWQMTERGIEYCNDENGSIVISYSHPEARIKSCLLHYGLIDAIKEILAN